MRFKRRRKPGPSKNQKKVERRADDARPSGGGPALGQAYPGVSSLTIQFAITSPQNELVTEETRRFSPGDPADLSCKCPGTCGVGAFDLTEKVSAMVEARETAGEASGSCPIEGFGGIPQPCAYVMKCSISIVY